MLLTNKSQIMFSVNVCLEFDNGTTKVVEIHDGDYLLMKFRYDGNILLRACRVVNIAPIILQTQPVSYTAALTVDCSTKFSADRLRVALKDILNIRMVDEDYLKSLAPDYEVTEELVRADAVPPTPQELYKRPGIGIAGIEEALVLR